MPSRFSEEENLGPVVLLVASETNEGRATSIWSGLATSGSLVKTAYPFFLHNIYVGLVPPFSSFFYAIISHYQIQALHLQPNSILLMAIFAFYCEAFMGVRFPVALLSHFLSLRFTTPGQRSASVSFVDVAGVIMHLKAGKKVEGYQNHWVFMDALRESLLLALHSGPPEQTSGLSHKKLTNLRQSLCWSKLPLLRRPS
ncbi:hypothetical protein D1007_38662 [Hordeum vulgare]|nr:hypothetical protein D1007_38662 [Hordeum vulgare]